MYSGGDDAFEALAVNRGGGARAGLTSFKCPVCGQLTDNPLEVHPLEPRWVHPLEVRSHLQQTKQQTPASADRTSTRMFWSGRLCSATFAMQIVGNTSITKHLVAETGPLGTCASGI